MQRTALIALIPAVSTLALGIGNAHAESATYQVEPTHTFATFEIDHFGASVNRGRFERKEGQITLDRTAGTGKVEITFHIDSLTTGVAPFEKHLKSDQILDAAKFPTATFVGDQFTFDGDKLTAVTGTLTIKGKAQTATFKANQFNCYESPVFKREVCGGDFETTIDRSAFGVDFGLNFGVPKEVRIVAQIEAVKQ